MQIDPNAPGFDFTHIPKMISEWGGWAVVFLIVRGPLRLERELNREREALEQERKEKEEWKSLALGHADLTKRIISKSQ